MVQLDMLAEFDCGELLRLKSIKISHSFMIIAIKYVHEKCNEKSVVDNLTVNRILMEVNLFTLWSPVRGLSLFKIVLTAFIIEGF